MNSSRLNQEHKLSSVAQYLYQNIHLLGFEKINRVLNTVLRETLDNSQDECTKNGILPDVNIVIDSTLKSKQYCIKVKDNGPGIPQEKVPYVTGQVLYGSKFTSNYAQRGQQGLGLKGINLYAIKTTGTPILVVSQTKQDHYPIEYVVDINLKTNTPIVKSKRVLEVDFFQEGHGFYVEALVKGIYTSKGPGSTVDLLRRYVYLNPTLKLKYYYDGELVLNYDRTSFVPLPIGKPVKKILHHQEIGDLVIGLSDCGDESLLETLRGNYQGDEGRFRSLLESAKIPLWIRTRELGSKEIAKIYKLAPEIFGGMRPPQEGLVMLNQAITTSVTQNYTHHYDTRVAYTSPPVFSGKGIIRVEVCAFYGGELPLDGKIELQRVANGSPLSYLSSSCLITKSIMDFNWKRYGLEQGEREMPRGPLLVVVHLAGTKLPFTGPGKDAIADIPEIGQLLIEGYRRIGLAIKRYRAREDLRASRDEKLEVITQTLPQIVRLLERRMARKITTEEGLSRICSKIMGNILMVHSNGIIRVYNGFSQDMNFKVGYTGILPCDYEAFTVSGNGYIELSVKKDYFIQDLHPEEYVILDKKA